MKRRDFLHFLSVVAPLGAISSCSTLMKICPHCYPTPNLGDDLAETYSADTPAAAVPEDRLTDMRARSEYFESDFPDDIWVRGERFETVVTLARKFDQIQRYVGHGNFNVLSFEDARRYADLVAGLDAFTSKEIKMLEDLFYFDATKYGFMGEKVFREIDHPIKKRDVIKVPYTGHFLLRGPSYETYQRLSRDVGEGLILTSGVRAQAKQFHLFLEKARETRGNLSRASRSLAPPGYSFHGRGDFDVGQVGAGLLNFTDHFASTDEFKRLIDLGYVDIRYEQSNLLGVRFEPWHIKVEG